MTFPIWFGQSSPANPARPIQPGQSSLANLTDRPGLEAEIHAVSEGAERQLSKVASTAKVLLIKPFVGKKRQDVALGIERGSKMDGNWHIGAFAGTQSDSG